MPMVIYGLILGMPMVMVDTLHLERKKFLTQAEYIIKAFVNNSCQLWMIGNE
jgi:hypothetical protein